MGLFSKLKEGLTKTRDNIVSGIDSVFSGFSSIDDDFYEELEETMIMGDMGVRATEEIIEELKQKVKENKVKDPQACRQLLAQGAGHGIGAAAWRERHHYTHGALGPGVRWRSGLGMRKVADTGEGGQGSGQQRGSNKVFHADSGGKRPGTNGCDGAWVNWSLKPCKMDAGLPLLGIEIWQLTIAFL